MSLVTYFGKQSDRLTAAIIRQRSDSPADHLLLTSQMGLVRKAQLDAVAGITPAMMLANVVNATAFLLMDLLRGWIDAPMLLWWGLVSFFALWGLRGRSKQKHWNARRSSSVRAPGKVVFSSCILAGLWTFPAFHLLVHPMPFEATFVASVTTGMIAGGALALYPVPLAAASYCLILSLGTFPSILAGTAGSALPFLLIIPMFLMVVAVSAWRHTGLFLSELAFRFSAENQRDLLERALQNESRGGQCIWQSDEALFLVSGVEEFCALLNVQGAEGCEPFLTEILAKCGARPFRKADRQLYNALMSLEIKGQHDLVLHFKTKSGEIFEIAIFAPLEDGAPYQGFQGYLKNVTHEIEAEAQLTYLASHDALTGAPNRAEFIRLADFALSQRLRKQDESHVGLLFVDADGLKAVNDGLGHHFGDQLLLAITEILDAAVKRQGGMVFCRKGGDEFLVFLIRDTAEDVIASARALFERLQGNCSAGRGVLDFSCCMGVSVSGKASISLEAMTREADRALHVAKQTGKRTFKLHDQDIGESVYRSRRLTYDLPLALESGELYLVYQPIVRMRSGRNIGAEALLRWTHEEFGPISPVEIINCARISGILGAVTEFVLKHALRHAASWPSESIISVNISARELQLRDFSTRILRQLDALSLPACQLWIEITEHDAFLPDDTMRENIASLRAAGVQMVIDDFGAGQTSLAYFREIHFDVMKLDRSLICGDRQDSNLHTILETILKLAAANNIDLVAEGIETPEQQKSVMDMGIEFGQGYLLGYPDSNEMLGSGEQGDQTLKNSALPKSA